MAKLQVVDTTGKKLSTLEVSDKLVMAKANPALVSQAVRVYLSNQRHAAPHIRPKSESAYTTAKMYRQKGTGRARHGSKKAAQFVGGVKAHGPSGEQNYTLKLSKKMKRAVLAQALSWHNKKQTLLLVNDLSKVEKKTKSAKTILTLVCDYPQHKKVLVVLEDTKQPMIAASKNLDGVKTTQVKRVNYYELLQHDLVLVTKEAMSVLNLMMTEKTKPLTGKPQVKEESV